MKTMFTSAGVILALFVAALAVTVSAAPWQPCMMTTTGITGGCIPSALYDGDVIGAVKWILSPVAPAPFNVTFKDPTGRVSFSPSFIDVAIGDASFETSLAVNYLTSDGRVNLNLAVWVQFAGPGAAGYLGGAGFWIHNFTTVPKVFCELTTPVYIFYPGTTSSPLNLTCASTTDSAVSFILPDYSAIGITFSPSVITLNPGDTWGAFTATSSSGAISLGSHPLNMSVTGVNATRYALPALRRLRVRPPGLIGLPPAFTAVAYRETDRIHLDLTIVPARSMSVTINVTRLDSDGVTLIDALANDEVELLPSNIVRYRSGTIQSSSVPNRGNFTLIGKRYGSYNLTFALQGSERANFVDQSARFVPVEIVSPEDGFAFTKRTTLGYLSNFRSCRIGVGRKSFFWSGREKVDEPMCATLPQPNLTEGAIVNCSQWISAERCQGVVEEKGHPCAWLRYPTPRCVDVPELRNVTAQVAFGLASTTFLDTNGSVWTIGSPRYGQLGRGFAGNAAQENVLGKVPLPEQAKSIAMGANHVLAVGKSGALYGWGANTLGQLGTGESEVTYYSPVAIVFPIYENVSCVSAGAQHSAIVSRGGRFYVWGSNSHGQLGRDPSVSNGGITSLIAPTAMPKAIFNNDALYALQCGERHTSVADSKGVVYTFGGNLYGQLGRDYRFYYSNKASSTAQSAVLSVIEATQSQLISNWKPGRVQHLMPTIPPVVPPYNYSDYYCNCPGNYTPVYPAYQIVSAPQYPSTTIGTFVGSTGSVPRGYCGGRSEDEKRV